MKPIRVKFLSKTPVDRMAPLWQTLVPQDGFPGVAFTFDPEARDYDVFAVYEDLPPRPGERGILRSEPLACPRERTLLITTEPSSIRVSGYNYLRQFGTVWTSVPYPQKRVRHHREGHPRWELTPPPLRWFYGRDLEGDDHWPVERLEASPRKTADLSTVCSSKAMGHTVHAQRLAFTMALKARLGNALSLYGRGFDPVGDKAEAMAPYRYHLAIENHRQPGHITEKLTDCFLAECLPFYFGAPDYTRYFPKDAVIPIDIFDLDAAERIIRTAIREDAYAKRREAIREAKAITMSDFNALGGVARFAHAVMKEDVTSRPGSVIHGRHAYRKAHPFRATVDVVQSAMVKRSRLGRPVQDA
ncbi:MAG: glycosyltransferase family 10 [Pseudomonadota bacterium]